MVAKYFLGSCLSEISRLPFIIVHRGCWNKELLTDKLELGFVVTLSCLLVVN